MDEMVALYDTWGQVVGTAPRTRVRAENLRHAATSIVVRDGSGRVFVHRRTDTKDVFPGLLDFCAGGVVAAGESPDASAARELSEELGISGVPLLRVGAASYRDDQADYLAFLYDVTYEGPVRLQPEEIAWGDWVDEAELRARVEADPDAFVPDSVALRRENLSNASDRPT